MNQEDAVPLRVFGATREALSTHLVGQDVTFWRPATLEDWVETGLLSELTALPAAREGSEPILFYTRGTVAALVEENGDIYALFEDLAETPEADVLSVVTPSNFRYRIDSDTQVSY